MKPKLSESMAADLGMLNSKINAFLPPQYQHCYGAVSPTSMGSAGLKYGPDGKVAWDEVWTSFCDLALAGGPPHRGKLLEPVLESRATADPERYQEVVAELDRAIGLTTGSATVEGAAPGWVGVKCGSPDEAAWLQYAVTAENVSARRRGSVLQLPAGPDFRIEKEIKNVVVAIAKSYHYWDTHLTAAQQTLAGESLWEPASPTEVAANPSEYEAAVVEVESGIRSAGVATAPRRYTGWVGVQLPNVDDAVWMLRAILVERVLVRREERVLYLPVGARPDPHRAAHVSQSFDRAWKLLLATS